MVSFIIITNGNKDNILLSSVEQIKAFDIEKEIIIVGKTFIDTDGLIYINFEEKDDLGWITRKKNIGCEMAKYDILVVLHDDIILEDNFAKNLTQLDFNTFDASAIRYSQGYSVFDWGYFGPLGHFCCCYKNSTKYSYVDGTAIVIKKNVFNEQKWNESLYINQAEDVEFSHRLINNGFRVVANPTLVGRTFGQGRCDKREFHVEGCGCEN